MLSANASCLDSKPLTASSLHCDVQSRVMMCVNDFLQASHLCSFPLCFHLVAHLEAIGMVLCKINKVRSQPLPLFFQHASLLLGADHLLFIGVMDKQFGLFCLFTYVGVPCVFLFFSQSPDSIAIQERVSQILSVLPLYFELYMVRCA